MPSSLKIWRATSSSMMEALTSLGAGRGWRVFSEGGGGGGVGRGTRAVTITGGATDRTGPDVGRARAGGFLRAVDLASLRNGFITAVVRFLVATI